MTRAWHALAAYTVITLAATWPLARGLGRDVAWDLGDSLLVMWILAWDAEQLLGILRGDVSRLASFFDADIFHPSPLTLAYSEHFIPQALQALPILALTDNPILAYNLLYLSTFILCGLGTYLFVRELTGKPAAAFLAGLLFAFAPYRMPQSPHLQVLSAQWMPFALYAFRRFFVAVDEGRSGHWPLAGAAAALITQNLSCGYYLLYFSPFAGAYALWEIAARGLWRRWRMWLALSTAAVAVLAATVPFLLPYLAVNEIFRFERSRSEVIRYSADVYSYATAGSEQLWGRILRAYPKSEGDLFLGVVPMLLGLAGLLLYDRTRPAGDARPPRASGVVSSPTADSWTWPGADAATRHRWLAPLLVAATAIHVLGAVAALVQRRILIDLGVIDIQISNVNQMLVRAAAAGALLLAVSPAARARVRVWGAQRGFFVAALAVAVWLSLGPVPMVLGRPVELAAPYGFLYEHVPGFDGVRVPARLGMIAALMLAVLAGYGAAALARGRRSWLATAVLCVAFLAESVVVPFPVNGATPTPGYRTPEARVYRPGRAPAIYREVAQLAPDAVLAELPLGEPDFDLRAMYYAIVHGRPLLNGYSGFFPPHYGRLALTLNDVPRFPDAALKALRTQGASHVLVHEDAYLDDRGRNTSAALVSLGARELYRDGGDVLLALP